jgi:hypothetical protein
MKGQEDFLGAIDDKVKRVCKKYVLLEEKKIDAAP